MANDKANSERQPSKPTQAQHFVSASYQKGWTDKRWSVPGYPKECVLWVFDLHNRRSFQTGPRAILTANFFYEKDSRNPDNELELLLQKYEADFVDAARLLDCALNVAIRKSKEEDIDTYALVAGVFDRLLESDSKCLTDLKRIASISYTRVPSARAWKERELLRHPIGRHLAKGVATPYLFVSAALDSSLEKRFVGLNAQLWVWPEAMIMTSDRPCVDVAASGEFFPLFGYDIGRRDDVIAFMPISSQMALVLAPGSFPSFEQRNASTYVGTKVLRPEEAEVINTFVINMADRWVLACNQDDAVFARRTRAIDRW